MALTDKITAIANAIREKSGKTELLTLDQIPAEISSLSTEELIKQIDIPEYVKKEVKELANRINEVKKDESIMFIAMSDMHHYGEKEPTVAGYTDKDGLQTNTSNLHAAMAAKALAYLYKFDFMAYLGDHIWGHKTTTLDTAIEQRKGWIDMIHEAHKKVPCFHAIGNHDTNTYYDEEQNKNGNIGNFLFSGQWLYDNFTKLSDSENTVFGNSTYGGYCYRDFPEKKLRVYLLNTSESIIYDKVTGTQYTPCCLNSQTQWFMETLLQLNEKTDASEWGFIVLSHYPADYGNAMSLSECFKAYVEGTSKSLKNEATNINYTANFSGKNKAKFYAQFHGHIHNFLASKLYVHESDLEEQYDAWRIATPNGQFARENYYDTIPAHPNISYQDETYGKIANSSNDTSFVVNIINPSEETIYSLHYGAGRDRVISLKSIPYYSINYSLSGVTSSNPSIAIQHGADYFTTLTIDEGKILTYLSIKLNGADVTDSVYNAETGEILISGVTGDIIIEATAIRQLLSKNQIIYSVDVNGNDFVSAAGYDGYEKGYYISSSGGAETARTNCYTTGFMRYTPGQKIRLENVGFVYGTDNPNSSYNRLSWYDINKNYIGQCNANHIWNLETKGGGIRNDKNEWISFTLNQDGDTITDSVSYIRFSCEYLTPESVITFDEEIVYSDQVADGIEITKTLNNVTLSNSASKVDYGTSYTSTIIVNDGYHFNNIVVTMGGQDITSTVFDESTMTIIIPRVNGQITITASAGSYLNLLPTAEDTADGSVYGTNGFQKNVYLSSGNPTSTSGNYYTSGFIPINGSQTIYFKNCQIQPNQSYHRIAFYYPDKTFISSSQANTTQLASNTNATMTWDENGYLSSIRRNDKYTRDAGWFRFCCSYIGNDSIVTVEEPIVD